MRFLTIHIVFSLVLALVIRQQVSVCILVHVEQDLARAVRGQRENLNRLGLIIEPLVELGVVVVLEQRLARSKASPVLPTTDSSSALTCSSM